MTVFEGEYETSEAGCGIFGMLSTKTIEKYEDVSMYEIALTIIST